MLSFQTTLVFTATAVALVSFCAYRLRGKRSDRAELSKEICEERERLNQVMAALPEQLELAKRLKLTEAPTMAVPSEATIGWLREFDADYASAKDLQSHLPPAELNESDHVGMELDLRLVEILSLSIRAIRLAEKYTPANAVPPDADADTSPPPHALQPRLSAIAP